MFRRLSVVMVILLALVTPPDLALAKGPPDRVTIAGPGLAEPITITDPEVLEAFSFYQFNDLENRVDAPESPGAGYVITRFVMQRAAGRMAVEPWDRVIYYPAEPGGYVFFEGLVDPNMWTEGQGHWYRASAAGEAAMRQILVAHGGEAVVEHPPRQPSCAARGGR